LPSSAKRIVRRTFKLLLIERPLLRKIKRNLHHPAVTPNLSTNPNMRMTNLNMRTKNPNMRMKTNLKKMRKRIS